MAHGQIEFNVREDGGGEYRKKGADSWIPFSSSLAELFSAVETGYTDSVHIAKMNITSAENYSDFISYENGIFTVLSDVTLLIIGMVEVYQTANASISEGAIYVNGEQIIFYETSYRYQGNKAGDCFLKKFTQGDTFYCYTPSIRGYPKQLMQTYIAENVSDALLDAIKKILELI